MGPQATRPDGQGVCRSHRCLQEFFANGLEKEEMEAKEEFPARDYIRNNGEIRKYCQTLGCQGFLAVPTECNRSISHWRMQEVSGKCNA